VVDLSNIKTITDWRVHDHDLPVLPPGEEYARVITPQKFCVLLHIAVLDVVLVRLRIGKVENVPFELLPDVDGHTRTYRPYDLDANEDLRRRLVETGAAVTTDHEIAIPPGMDVRATVRNQGEWATQFRVALVVRQEPHRE